MAVAHPAMTFQPTSTLRTSKASAPASQNLTAPVMTPDPESVTTKKKGFQPHVPWAVLIFAGMGGWGLLAPTTVMYITELVATNFAVRFNGQDLIGMGAPRVSVSLTRDAKPYDPEDDPYLKEHPKTGLERYAYVKRQQIKNLNWPNLKEEMYRELAAAPGVLFISTVGSNILKPMSRVTQGALPPGRRGLELGHGELKTFAKSFQTFIEEGPPELHGESAPKQIKAYYQSLFEPTQSAYGESFIDKPVSVSLDLSKMPSDAEYKLTDEQILHLIETNENGIGDQLSGRFQKRGLFKKQAETWSAKVEHPEVRLSEVVERWADAMAEHAELEISGVKANLLSSAARQQNERAQARMSYYSQLLEQTVEKLNNHRPATHQKSLGQWNIRFSPTQTEAMTLGGRVGFIRQADKFRDVLATAAREAKNGFRVDSIASTMDKTLRNVVSTRYAMMLGFTSATCAYIWWLSHAIQKDREYPANRFHSESASAIGNVATASNSKPVMESSILGAQASQNSASASSGSASQALVPVDRLNAASTLSPVTKAQELMPLTFQPSANANPFALTPGREVSLA